MKKTLAMICALLLLLSGVAFADTTFTSDGTGNATVAVSASGSETISISLTWTDPTFAYAWDTTDHVWKPTAAATTAAGAFAFSATNNGSQTKTLSATAPSITAADTNIVTAGTAISTTSIPYGSGGTAPSAVSLASALTLQASFTGTNWASVPATQNVQYTFTVANPT